jgi:hypothetical protein
MIRARQDQPDQRNMNPVVGHLVDEQGPRGVALDARGVQIALAHRAQILARELCQTRRIIGHLARELGDIGQFAGALDLAVAGQDLLDQRGAGARHADHEDRIGRRAAGPSPPRTGRRRLAIIASMVAVVSSAL